MDRTRLKYIAAALMLLDHIGARFLFSLSWPLYMVCRCLGRLSFPVFAWMVAEGLHKSHDRKKYLERLLIFAAISEVSFRFAFGDSGSVILTFLLAGAAIFCADTLLEKEVNLPTALLPVLAAMLLAEVLDTDYGLPGVLLVAILYYMEDQRKPKLIFTAVWGLAFPLLWQALPALLAGMPAGLMTPNLEVVVSQFVTSRLLVFDLPLALCTAASALLLARYNGEPGRGNKWFFYVFYPAHLAVLGLVAMLLP